MKTLLLLTLVVLAGGSTTTAQENTLRGHVVEDHSGPGLGGVTIRVSQSGLAGVLKEAETDRSGEFTVTGLGPGNYQFAVAKSNYMPNIAPEALRGMVDDLFEHAGIFLTDTRT